MRGTPEIASKKSPFHISWNGLFSSHFFHFLSFSHEKDEKNTASGCVYYTTTRNIWELQRRFLYLAFVDHYTTTRNIWELQLQLVRILLNRNYTTTRNIWELQRISITKNYWCSVKISYK